MGMAGIPSGPSLSPLVVPASWGAGAWYLVVWVVALSGEKLELIRVGGAICRAPPGQGFAPRPGVAAADPGSWSRCTRPRMGNMLGCAPGAPKGLSHRGVTAARLLWRLWQAVHAGQQSAALSRAAEHEDVVRQPHKGHGPAGSPQPVVVVSDTDPLYP